MELVYVIGSKDTGVPFKIGKSNKKSLKNRLQSIQTGNPNSLEIFYQYHSKKINSLLLEKTIRDKLVQNHGFKQLHGEWITTDADKPIETVGSSIQSILKDLEYKPKDDPNYHALIKKNELQHKKYNSAVKKYNKKAEQFVEFLNDFLCERKEINAMDKSLYATSNKLFTYQIDKAEPFDWKYKSNYNNFLEWLHLFYKMYNKQVRYNGMNQQNYNHKFEINSFFDKNITMYLSEKNDGIATEKYIFNINDEEIIAETPYRDEAMCTLRRGENRIIGKCFLDDTTLNRRYNIDNDNVDLYDTINFNVPKELTYHPKEIYISYNNEKSKTYILKE